MKSVKTVSLETCLTTRQIQSLLCECLREIAHIIISRNTRLCQLYLLNMHTVFIQPYAGMYVYLWITYILLYTYKYGIHTFLAWNITARFCDIPVRLYVDNGQFACYLVTVAKCPHEINTKLTQYCYIQCNNVRLRACLHRWWQRAQHTLCIYIYGGSSRITNMFTNVSGKKQQTFIGLYYEVLFMYSVIM